MKYDITGQKFGRLTAVEPIRAESGKGTIWRCRCECGNEKEVPAGYLKRGQTQSCGCIRKKDYTGQKFSRLTAVSFQYYNDRHQACWKFLCDCGNETILPLNNVKWGNTKSCGCLLKEHIGSLQRENITGVRYGRLTAVQPTEKRDSSGSVIWECTCDCGNTACYSVNTLKTGKVQSCGCRYQESRRECGQARKDTVDGTSLSSLIASKGRRKNNTSGCTGVYHNPKNDIWIAYIYVRKTRHYLGSFPTYDQAVDARKTAEQTLHDPIISAKMDLLTDKSKGRFLEYLQETDNA